MKTTLFVYLLLLSGFLFSQSILSPALVSELGKNEKDYIDVNIYFNSNYDIYELARNLDAKKASFDLRTKSVNDLLNKNAEISLSEFAVCLDFMLNQDSRVVENIKYYRVANALNIEIKPNFIYYLADQKFIRFIDINSTRYKIVESELVMSSESKLVGGTEPGLKAINAHKLWEMGYTGRNILFLSMDTGVHATHPAISDNFAGNYFPLSQCWYGIRNPKPVDNAGSSHGTHTTGTVLGLDRVANDTIGVAFNAKWIASDPVASGDSDLLTPEDFMAVFDWVLNPDGDETTSDDVPRVINNSWGYNYNLALDFGACDLPEAEILVTIETAGICSPFSAGNEGPGAGTTGFPAMLAYNIVNPMSIGAVNGNSETLPIADFSSRGPSPCVEEEGRIKIKPEVVAPGVYVRSASGTDSYSYLQGTSMACPHVSGALLLLAEAFPMASAYELKLAIYETASDLGEEGEDNVYGNGMIDVLSAFEYLSDIYTPVPPISNEYDLSLELTSSEKSFVCQDEKFLNVQMKVNNLGQNLINGFNIKVYLNEEIVCDSSINENIAEGDIFEFLYSNLELLAGENYIHGIVKPLEDFSEYDRFNNAFNHRIFLLSEVDSSYYQNFENISDLQNSEFVIINPDFRTTWSLLNWGENDEHKAIGVNFLEYTPKNWNIDDLYLPEITMPAENDSMFLSFTYAYKRRTLNLYKDSLIIEVSTDCGLSFDKILFAEGGENLATVEGNSNYKFYKPIEASEFDTINISLNEFKGEKLVIRFRTKNDNGSVLYIDEMKIGVLDNSSIYSNKLVVQEPEIYPNPTSDIIFVKIYESEEFVNIYDLTGRLVLNQKVYNEISKVNLGDLTEGVYFIHFINSGKTKKLIKK
ncbi:MAG TPA: S8 family peptidase [Bacteroidales bacterium]|nr:S8 family peptidase [Bacteroidales bacterium]